MNKDRVNEVVEVNEEYVKEIESIWREAARGNINVTIQKELSPTQKKT